MLAHPKLHFWQLIKINVFLVIDFSLFISRYLHKSLFSGSFVALNIWMSLPWS